MPLSHSHPYRTGTLAGSRVAHTRAARNFFEQAFQEGPRLDLGVTVQLGVDQELAEVLGSESRIQRPQVEQASHEQPGADQQQQRKPHFAGHQQFP